MAAPLQHRQQRLGDHAFDPKVVETDEEFFVDSVGISGLGPDPVTVPHDAPPGNYRVCTGNAGDNVCAPSPWSQASRHSRRVTVVTTTGPPARGPEPPFPPNRYPELPRRPKDPGPARRHNIL